MHDSAPMKIFVIGATGYVGSHAVRRLAADGHSLSGSARSEKGEAVVRACGATPVRCDLAQPESLRVPIRQADAVIYAAQLQLEPEHVAVRGLLDELAGTGKTIIFTSGTGVLSQKTDGDWSEDSFSEHDSFVPAKWLVRRTETETLVRSAAEQGIRAMVVRPPMIWGNGGCGLIEAFYASARATGSVCYLERGLNLYSNVHIEDLAELYALALGKGVAGALYHCVAGEVANRTIAGAVARQLGCDTRSIDFGQAVDIWGKFMTLIIMSTCSRSRSPRARAELGWAPRHPDMLSDVGDSRYKIQGRAP